MLWPSFVQVFQQLETHSIADTVKVSIHFNLNAMETFRFGDILTHLEDNSKWKFKRYVIDKVTVSAEWAKENNWQGSEGSKTWLYAVPLADGEEAQEKKLASNLLIKAKQE